MDSVLDLLAETVWTHLSENNKVYIISKTRTILQDRLHYLLDDPHRFCVWIYCNSHRLSAFLVVLDFVLALFRITWWSSSEKELSSWSSACVVLYLMHHWWLWCSRLVSWEGCVVTDHKVNIPM